MTRRLSGRSLLRRSITWRNSFDWCATPVQCLRLGVGPALLVNNGVGPLIDEMPLDHVHEISTNHKAFCTQWRAGEK